MSFLVVAILFSTAFSQFYKAAGKLGHDVMSVTLGCCIGAAVPVLLYLFFFKPPELSGALVSISVLGGLSTFGAVSTFFYASRLGRLSISWTIISFSAVIPIVASWVLYGEVIPGRRIIGIALAAVSIIMLGIDQSCRRSS